MAIAVQPLGTRAGFVNDRAHTFENTVTVGLNDSAAHDTRADPLLTADHEQRNASSVEAFGTHEMLESQAVPASPARRLITIRSWEIAARWAHADLVVRPAQIRGSVPAFAAVEMVSALTQIAAKSMNFRMNGTPFVGW